MVEILIAGLSIMVLAFIQNVSFSITSRSRNRNNMWYHVGAASVSNTIWFLTFRELILANMAYTLLPFYMVGTVLGSVFGVKVAMWIEGKIGATADGHLQNK